MVVPLRGFIWDMESSLAFFVKRIGRSEERNMVKRSKSLIRELSVCAHPGCGVAYCCKIPRLQPTHIFWCDNPCQFKETDNCTQLRGYTGDPNNPYKAEVFSGQNPPFKIIMGKCLQHFEQEE